jgi:hypothetical protein
MLIRPPPSDRYRYARCEHFMATRKTRTLRIIWLMLIVGLLCAAYGGYRIFNPYDEVAADIQGIPPNTGFVCLLADTDNGPQAMDWSLAKVFPFSMHPDGCTVSLLLDGKTSHRANVRWISSERVGVLRRTANRKWIVSWFRPPKSQPKNRSLLFGGGTVTIDLADADNDQQMAADQLRALGWTIR